MGAPRLVWTYAWSTGDAEKLHAFSDTDFAGCRRTRRSTSGGAILRGNHCLKAYSTTQTTIALSSAEAELSGLVTGATHALGLRSIALDLGIRLDVVLWSDASAAIGIARRKGLGKVRHLDVADLWIQDKLREGQLQLHKVAGPSNPADMLTKYVDKTTILKHLSRIGTAFESGRAQSAPSLTENQKGPEHVIQEHDDAEGA